MCDSSVVKELPETSIWHGAISDDDVALVRRRHAEKVEEWLDFADFATELFALHEKYGIEKGEEGYFAYRKHLRTGYYEKLYTYGPTPDPLDEGCDCIFCRMHADEPEDCRVRCADQPGERLHRENGPHSGPYGMPESVPPYDAEYEKVAGDTSRYDSVGGVELDGRNDINTPPGPIVPIYPLNPSPPPSPYPKESRLGQVPAEPPIDSDTRRDQSPDAKPTTIAMTALGAEKLGLVPAYEKIEAPPVETKAGRVRCADEITTAEPSKNGPHSGPYIMTESVRAESPAASARQEERRRREKRYGPDPVYVKTAGEKAWLKKMAGSVF